CNLAGFEVAHEAVQAMGATGYSRDTIVEWCMRRTRGWMIAGGSIEMLKNRIAEHVFDRRFDQRGRQAAAAEGDNFRRDAHAPPVPALAALGRHRRPVE